MELFGDDSGVDALQEALRMPIEALEDCGLMGWGTTLSRLSSFGLSAIFQSSSMMRSSFEALRAKRVGVPLRAPEG